MKCPYCGNENKEGAKYCASCGRNLECENGTEPAGSRGFVYCPYCGERNEADAQFCLSCGNELFPEEEGDLSQPETTFYPDSAGEGPAETGTGASGAGAAKRRRIILIVVLAAACVAAVIIAALVLRGRSAAADAERAGIEEEFLAEAEEAEEAKEALAGTGEEEETSETSEEEEEAPESAEEEEAPESAEEEKNETAKDPAVEEADHSDISSITFSKSYENATESAVVTAVDVNGSVVWTYQTPGYPAAESDQIVELGRKDDVYYMVQGLHLIALDVQTGDVLWENEDSCGSPSPDAFAFGDDAIYISGFYGPDLIAVSYEGKTLKEIESFSSDYFWPYQLDLSGNDALVYFDGGPETDGGPWVFRVDLSTWEYAPDGETTVGQSGFKMSDVTTVYASSFLDETQVGISHDPSNVVDGTLDNAWCENASGQGVGEYVLINFNNIYRLTGMTIYAGYQKSEDLYYKNSRPKEIRITFADGSFEDVTLSDAMGPQTVTFTRPVDTSSVEIMIRSVYPGSAYEDTLISEVSFY